MITRVLGLAMVLTITLAVTTPARAYQQAEPSKLPNFDIGTATPIPGYPDFEITNKGLLVYGGDRVVGKCGATQDFGFQSKSLDEQATRACEKAEQLAPLPDTGGLPIILVPIGLPLVGALLFRKSTAP